jgi:hypothetical protein
MMLTTSGAGLSGVDHHPPHSTVLVAIQGTLHMNTPQCLVPYGNTIIVCLQRRYPHPSCQPSTQPTCCRRHCITDTTLQLLSNTV